MQKNIIIGLLVVAIVILGGIFLLSKQNDTQLSVLPINSIESQNQEAQIYENNHYGFSFEYPSYFKLEEKDENLGSTDDITCPNLFMIAITDPKTSKLQLEARGEKTYNSLTVSVRKASCYNPQLPNIDLNKSIATDFVKKGYIKSIAEVISIAIPSVGERPDDKSDVVWKNSCTVGSVKTNEQSVSYIKNVDCLLDSGLFEETIAFIPFAGEGYFIEIRANKNPYDTSESSVVDSILSSFSFKK